jgi:transcriptional regulator with XRE-family HTH domain
VGEVPPVPPGPPGGRPPGLPGEQVRKIECSISFARGLGRKGRTRWRLLRAGPAAWPRNRRGSHARGCGQAHNRWSGRCNLRVPRRKQRLRDSSQLRIGQIANRTGYTPGHISEVLRGWKAPSPDAAAKIAQVLGADESTVRRARRRAEELQEWKRESAGKQPLASSLSGGHGDQNVAGFPIRHQLSSPDVEILVIAGDLFDQETHLAIGFSDTFDTSVADDRIIHSSSVQAQLLRRVFGGDQQQLDEQLAAALAAVPPVHVRRCRCRCSSRPVAPSEETMFPSVTKKVAPQCNLAARQRPF